MVVITAGAAVATCVAEGGEGGTCVRDMRRNYFRGQRYHELLTSRPFVLQASVCFTWQRSSTFLMSLIV